MIRRATSPDRINEIFNHPQIHPWVNGDNAALSDVTERLKHPNFIGLEGDHGCFLVQHLETGIYEFHTAVLPEYQGKWARQFFKAGLDWMFTHTNAVELLTKCPVNNPASRMACALTKFQYCWTTGPIYSSGGIKVACDIMSMTIQNWATSSDILLEKGQRFHMELEEQYAALGDKPALHEESMEHDRYVGAAVLMIENGFPLKAVSFYNRWALMSSYQPISVVSLDPLVIDIFESKLLVTDNHFEVL